MCDIPLLTKPTLNKPGLDIYCPSVNCKTISATEDVELKSDLIVYGSVSSSNFSPGVTLIGTSTLAISTPGPGSSGGQQITYNRLLNKAVVSGLSGVNTAFSTVNGFGTMTRLTTPFSNPIIEYSPTLNLYTGLDATGTAIYTSTDALAWTLRPASAITFVANELKWIPEFNRFYAGAAGNDVLSSLDGITYTLQTNGRQQLDYAYGVGSDGVGRLVAVGNDSASYSEDGLTWSPANTSVASRMSSVCYSSFFKAWFAAPRILPLNIIYMSEDGINWTAYGNQAFSGINVRTIIWIDKLMIFVASGDGDTLFVSQDGFIWKRVQTSGVVYDSYGSKWIDEWGQYVSCGISSHVRVSPKMFV